jgi:hypothetical protein
LDDVEAVFKDSEVSLRRALYTWTSKKKKVVHSLKEVLTISCTSWQYCLLNLTAVLATGTPCNREEGRGATNSYECIRVNFYV